MAKQKILFYCTECGAESLKWYGKCPNCSSWNTIEEVPSSFTNIKNFTDDKIVNFTDIKAAYISDISLEEKDRYSTGFLEFDRVLGGGIVAGSLILLGGDPGIGKSTILLQTCINLANSGLKVLYVSGEESLKQIKIRAIRLGDIKGELKFLAETKLEIIRFVVEEEKPDVLIIDSIQTMMKEDISSSAGSVSQVRESTNTIMNLAKTSNTAVFIVGHVTKEGQVAGPRVLEHMVDVVLYFEGEKTASYRILRGVKNRFGSTNEIGVFEMLQLGLAEVKNPSEYMINERPLGSSGTVVACLIEGTRPILVELQALITKTNFGMPRRTAAGVDFNRFNLLLAVIEKRSRLNMSMYDAYVNIAGGIKISETALDLAIILAVISSLKDISINPKTMIFGEVGLLGEVRTVSLPEQRIREGEKLGFEICILPKTNLQKLNYKGNMKLLGVSSIKEALDYIR